MGWMLPLSGPAPPSGGGVHWRCAGDAPEDL
jgi:hypothetical protein